MSARDELIELVLPILEKCFDSDWNMTYSEMVADAILAAGYSKPRTISTAEELDALPFGSVVIDRAEWVLCKRDERRYAVAGSAGQYSAATIEFPATVLYTPKES